MDKKEKEGEKSPSLVHDFNPPKEKTTMKQGALIIFTIVLLLGIGTGYLFASKSAPSTADTTTLSKSDIKKGETFGTKDESTFKDSVEGVLKPGGVSGEGAFHLERPGGKSQNVYLTSSVVDLSKFLNRKVKVWGQTQTAQQAGWLMDVGRLQVLN